MTGQQAKRLVLLFSLVVSLMVAARQILFRGEFVDGRPRGGAQLSEKRSEPETESAPTAFAARPAAI